MPKRAVILMGMAAGLYWAVALLWLGMGPFARGGSHPLNLLYKVGVGLFLAGLPQLALIARLSVRRFFDDSLIDGQAYAPGSSAEIDQRVLTNTTEQLILALCLWPFASFVLGPGILIPLGAGFAIARVCFWIGYHLSPPLRGFGFAASFYPTILAALLAAGMFLFDLI